MARILFGLRHLEGIGLSILVLRFSNKLANQIDIDLIIGDIKFLFGLSLFIFSQYEQYHLI